MTTRRRTPDQLRIVDRDRADRRVRDNMGLIVETLRREFPWTLHVSRDLWEQLVAVCGWSVARADRDYDEERGTFATIATKYMVNDVRKHEKKRRRHRERWVDVDIVRREQRREMRPDVAAVVNETVRRNTPVEMFGEDVA